MGSKKYPKEQLRVFSNGKVFELNNYVKMTKYGAVKTAKMKLKQDKGVPFEYDFIVDVLVNGKKNNTIEDAFENHRFLLSALNK